MIIPMLCVTIFVILVVWFLLPRVARLMIHTPTAISIFVCLSMVQLMAVFISMRCTLCGHFLQVALTLILVVGYAIDRKSGSAGMPRPISYAVFCLKKKKENESLAHLMRMIQLGANAIQLNDMLRMNATWVSVTKHTRSVQI